MHSNIMNKLENAIKENFKNECDIRDDADRRAFIGIIVSYYNKYDTKAILKELKDVATLLEEADRAGEMDAHRESLRKLEESEKKLEELIDKYNKKDEKCHCDCDHCDYKGLKPVKTITTEGKSIDEIIDAVEKIIRETFGEDEDGE